MKRVFAAIREGWGRPWFTVRSAEGGRSELHRSISAAERTRQRDRLEKAGFQRIRRVGE